MAPLKPESPALRLIARIQRRWWLRRAAERATLGLVAGLAVVAVLMWLAPELAGGAYGMLLGIALVGFIAGWLLARPPSVAAAADRIDEAHRAREVFGTLARLTGEAAPGVRAAIGAAADATAERLVGSPVELPGRGRVGWLLVTLGAAGLVTAIALAAAAGQSGETRLAMGHRFVGGDELLGDPSRAAIGQHPPAARAMPDQPPSAAPDFLSTRRPAGAEQVSPHDLGEPTDAGTGDSAGRVPAGGAEAGLSDHQSATRLPDGQSARDQSTRTLDAADGSGARAGPAANDVPADGEGTADAPAPRLPMESSPPVIPGNAPVDHVALERHVPAAYRDLVRRFFAAD